MLSCKRIIAPALQKKTPGCRPLGAKSTSLPGTYTDTPSCPTEEGQHKNDDQNRTDEEAGLADGGEEGGREADGDRDSEIGGRNRSV